MKWLLLLSLFACASHHEKADLSQAKPETAPTESNAKPVSPLTVEPCYCMKIFQPVCANGQDYGNSCEAECHGNKAWTDGHCKK